MSKLVWIQDEEAVVDLEAIASIDTSDSECWEVTLVSGDVFSFEGKDLVQLKAYVKAVAFK